MTVKDSEIIALALDKYLGTPEQWCQRTWARDDQGMPTDTLNPDAVSHCAEGAITAAIYESRGTASLVLSHELAEHFREIHPHLQILTKDAKAMLIPGGPPVPAKPGDVRAPRDTLEYNDHPLMTYEGVRAAMEKYRAALQEQGR